ncbi:beta strand repeat-containing protein [Granulicella cerasi]|uniref:Beta strand repeat-containing protein n=1 Tax=Granulicella cerasi TaxID=741063 RepID=A0ABW1Z6S8_9BACT|nr:Ig domain-containing protein [Granulicella cerasi]
MNPVPPSRSLRPGLHSILFTLVAIMILFVLSGCGSGGYPGTGITKLSASAITIDSGQSFAFTASVAGGGSVNWSLGGSCSGAACGMLSASSGASVTYTAPTVTEMMKVTLTGSLPGTKSTSTATITVNPSPSILGAPTSGVIGTPYSYTVTTTGGTAPVKLSVLASSLPAGLTFDVNTGIISGTPTTAGSGTLMLSLSDTSDVPLTIQSTLTVTINSTTTPPTSITLSGNPTSGTVGTAYSATFTATGGTAPYTFSIAGGALPTGLTLSTAGVISGTPTAAGTYGFTVKVVDANNATASAAFTVVIGGGTTTNPLTITTGTLPDGTVGVAYSSTIGVSGGTAPYGCTLASGTLPAGLTLGTNCVVSGTPTTAGTSSFNVKVVDSASPVNTVTGPVSIKINAAATVISISGNPPAGTVGAAYAVTLTAAGGTAPYTFTIISGALPTGLTLSTSGAITGTPTTAGSYTFGVQAADANSATGTASFTVAIGAGTTTNPLTITTGTLPDGTVNVAYSSAIGVSGGTAPYGCTITSGSLPAGLTMSSNCLVTGTPTTAGTATFTVQATDSSSPMNTVSGPITLKINPAAVLIAIGNPPAATVGTAYTGTIPVSGGTAPYSCTLVSGALPAGLTLGANCTVTGTPTVAGSASITVKATDSASPSNTTNGPVTLTVNAAAATIVIGNPPAATVGTVYSGAIPVSGGTAPYTCSLVSGTLPAGLTLAGNCSISGTPTTSGTSTFTVKATDSASPVNTTTGAVSLTVNAAAPTITIGNPPAATTGQPYTGTIPVTGGTGPYSCTITSGTLPTGLTLGAACTITGTPTTPGSTMVTIHATDSSSPQGSATAPITVTVGAAGTITIIAPGNATVGVPYTGTIGATGGTAPYTCALQSGTLPNGLTQTGCTISGTPTATGTFTVQEKVTDSSTTPLSTTGPVSITVSAGAALSLTGSLPNAIVNQTYSQTLQATGGAGPYTYAVTTGSLPAGLSLASSGAITGIPTTVGASSFTVTVTDSEVPAKTATNNYVLQVVYAPTTTDSALKGPYAFLFQGYDDVLLGVLAYKTSTAGQIYADGNGLITSGVEDSNHQTTTVTTGNVVPTRTVVGSYTVGTDYRGFLTLTTFNTDGTVLANATYAIALKAPAAPATITARASMIRYDNASLAGERGSGTLYAQNATAVSTGLSGSYVFGTSGDTPCLLTCTLSVAGGPVAAVGRITTGAGGTLTGTTDSMTASTGNANATVTGTFSATDATGRATAVMNVTNATANYYPTDYVVYIIDANNAIMMSTDQHSSFILLAGTMQKQTATTFGNAALNTPMVGYENALPNPGLLGLGVTVQNVLNFSTATLIQVKGAATGSCNTNYSDMGSTTALVSNLTSLNLGLLSSTLNDLLQLQKTTGPSNCTADANGRGEFDYPAPSSLLATTLQLLGINVTVKPRTVYLSSVGTGYFLETGYAGLGQLQAQTGAPFTAANFKGTYVYSSLPAASLASTDTSGTITSTGTGSATSTLDLNVGVGNINLLQLGTTSTQTYTLTDATAGRYTMGTMVFYDLGANQFVLIDTSALVTSPTVNLLY